MYACVYVCILACECLQQSSLRAVCMNLCCFWHPGVLASGWVWCYYFTYQTLNLADLRTPESLSRGIHVAYFAMMSRLKVAVLSGTRKFNVCWQASSETQIPFCAILWNLLWSAGTSYRQTVLILLAVVLSPSVRLRSRPRFIFL